MSSITYRIATGRDAGRKVVTLQALPGDVGSLEGDAGKVGGFLCMPAWRSRQTKATTGHLQHPSCRADPSDQRPEVPQQDGKPHPAEHRGAERGQRGDRFTISGILRRRWHYLSYASSICGPTPTYSMRRRAARPARRRCDDGTSGGRRSCGIDGRRRLRCCRGRPRPGDAPTAPGKPFPLRMAF
jgi:hypothetical protein